MGRVSPCGCSSHRSSAGLRPSPTLMRSASREPEASRSKSLRSGPRPAPPLTSASPSRPSEPVLRASPCPFPRPQSPIFYSRIPARGSAPGHRRPRAFLPRALPPRHRGRRRPIRRPHRPLEPDRPRHRREGLAHRAARGALLRSAQARGLHEPAGRGRAGALAHRADGLLGAGRARARRLAREWNDGASAAHTAHPDRFVVSPRCRCRTRRWRWRELDRAAKLPGVRARLHGHHVDGRDLDDPAFFPVLRALPRRCGCRSSCIR